MFAKGITCLTLFLLLFFFSISHTLYSKSKTNIELIGDILQIATPIATLALTYQRDDSEGRRSFLKGFTTNFILTHMLKRLIDKRRPDGGYYSFPSGHTSATFQSATFIHRRYGLNDAYLAYLSAIFVGYSRVYAKKHYVSDVVAGASLGSISTIYFTKRF
ncbi:MAG: phosphatase PAP2 family protein [bacterium]